jgi:hypothetical protein
MKRSSLILTHAAVFAVGIAVAMTANRGDSSAAQEAAAGATAGSSRSSALDSGNNPSERITRRAPNGTSKGSATGGTAADRFSQVVLITDRYERQRAMMNLIDQLSPDEFASVADQFREIQHLGGTGGDYSLLLQGWAKADPLAALQYVDAHPDSQRGRNTILESWAGKDAAAAESWALAQHDGDGPNPHLAAVISGIAANDIDHANRLVQTMPNSRERAQAIQAMTRALLLQGTEAALAFPNSITDPQLRGSFVTEISGRLARQDPERAASWVASISDGEIQNRAARNIADALARQDPAKASAWVATLQPEARVSAATAVIPLMSSNDIAGTARWVATLAGSPGYDRAVEAFVLSCDSRAPEQSAAWIRAISDTNQQRRLYHRMIGDWARRDAAAARQWVANNDVPEDIQRRFNR